MTRDEADDPAFQLRRLAALIHLAVDASVADDVSITARTGAAEIERLRAALREIGGMGPHTAAWSAQNVALVALGDNRQSA